MGEVRQRALGRVQAEMRSCHCSRSEQKGEHIHMPSTALCVSIGVCRSGEREATCICMSMFYVYGAPESNRIESYRIDRIG